MTGLLRARDGRDCLFSHPKALSPVRQFVGLDGTTLYRWKTGFMTANLHVREVETVILIDSYTF